MSISACNNFNRCSLKIPGESSIGAQFYSARFTWYTVDLNHGYEWLYERIPGLCSSVSITRKIEKKREKERERERERDRARGRQREKQKVWRGMKRDWWLSKIKKNYVYILSVPIFSRIPPTLRPEHRVEFRSKRNKLRAVRLIKKKKKKEIKIKKEGGKKRGKHGKFFIQLHYISDKFT